MAQLPTSASCPRQVAERIRDAARRAAPHEACGVLGGHRHGDHVAVECWIELGPEHPAVDAFSVDPAAFARAEAELRADGVSWVGFVHSHPGGAACPSVRDLEQLWRGCLHLVVGGRALRDIGAFWLQDSGATKLQWEESPS